MKEQTILVVDDQKGIRLLISEVLKEENYKIYSANNGIEAIAMLQRVKPDLILLDMRMPGMSGLELNKEIALLNLNIPIIMMTAYGELNLVNRLKEQGINHILSKPFDVADLKKMVSSVLKPQAERVHA